MNKNKPPSSSSDLLPLLIIILLFLCLVLGIWLLSRPITPPSENSASTNSSISADRLIFGGLPKPLRPDSNYTTLRNTGYVSGYSEARKDPLWVSYRVFQIAQPFISPRPKGNFLTDTRTHAQVTHQDYTPTNYDRGHMAPNSAIATRYGADAQKETFLLSNICPQTSNLNQKVWKLLEIEEINYADAFEEVWVIDGPIFADLNGGPTKTLASGVHIPTAFYKIVIDEQQGQSRTFAVIIPQDVKGYEKPDQFLVSIQKIQQETQLDFLPELDAKTQHQLESQPHPMWVLHP